MIEGMALRHADRLTGRGRGGRIGDGIDVHAILPGRTASLFSSFV